MEIICRLIQSIETRSQDNSVGGDVAGTGRLEHHLMAGSDAALNYAFA